MKFPFGPGILSEAMLVAGTVPWPLCILQENRGPGWGGDGDIHALAHM